MFLWGQLAVRGVRGGLGDVRGVRGGLGDARHERHEAAEAREVDPELVGLLAVVATDPLLLSLVVVVELLAVQDRGDDATDPAGTVQGGE